MSLSLNSRVPGGLNSSSCGLCDHPSPRASRGRTVGEKRGKEGRHSGSRTALPCICLLSLSWRPAQRVNSEEGASQRSLLRNVRLCSSLAKGAGRKVQPTQNAPSKRRGKGRPDAPTLPRVPPPAPAVGAGAPGKRLAPCCCHQHTLLASGLRDSRPAGPWPPTSGPGNQ